MTTASARLSTLASLSSAVRICVSLLVALAFLSLTALEAFGQSSYTVTRFDDTSVGTLETGGGYGPGASGDLRYGLYQALANGGVNTITFACSAPPCTIQLAAPLPPIFETTNISGFNLTIDGGTQGNVVLDGAGAYRVFWVDNVAVTLKNLLIQNALALGGNGGGGGGAGFGAGLFVNQATALVNVQNTSFLNCSVVGGNGGAGGGGGGMGFAGLAVLGGGGGGVSGPANNDTSGGAGGGGGGGPVLEGGDNSGGTAFAANDAGKDGGDERGGNGGFGGGGGTSYYREQATAGNGGFGGGGGLGLDKSIQNGAGGFGGGGGGFGATSAPAVGGIQGGASDATGNGFGAGGGAAAGPAIFVVNGSVTLYNSTGSGFTATAGAGGDAGATAGTASSMPVFNYGGAVNGSIAPGPIQNAFTVTVAIGQSSAVQTATLNIPAAIASSTTFTINVLTQGIAGLDFSYVTGGTCASGQNYSGGATCTVEYSFTPQHPGIRLGAITLTDGSGNLLASALVSGIGTGPQLAFQSSGTVINPIGGGFNYPNAIAVDAGGNSYAFDSDNALHRIPAGCSTASCVSTLSFAFNAPRGVAIDGAGNLYVADPAGSPILGTGQGTGAVYEIPAGCSASACVLTVLTNPSALSVIADGNGNIFIGVITNNGGPGPIFELSPCGSSSCVTQLGGGFLDPYQLALDAGGNLYVADAAKVYTMVPGCASSACVTQLGGGFHGPHGVAVDSSGSVYVADTFNNAVKRMPPGCGSENCVTTIAGGLHYPYGLALDGSGNVFVAENSNNAIQAILLAAPSALSFATPTTDGTNDTTDNPQAETVWNNGNAPLIIDSPTPSISPGFALGSEATSCAQLPNMTLPVAAGCTLTATFAPVAPDSGTVSGSITLTDNALNAANAGQSIPLSGTAVLPPPVPSVGAGFANSNPLNLGASESFSVSMTNPSGTVAIPSFSLTLQLPAGLQVVAGSLGGSCTGGVVTYAPSSSTITHTGLSLAAGANCQDSFTLKATGLGSQTVTATVASGGQVASASPQVNVVDVATSLTIAVPASAYRGSNSNVTVTAVDSSGTQDAAYTGTVSFTSTDAAATLPANYTFTAADAGAHTFTATLNTAGNQTITATDASDGLAITSSSIAVSTPNLVVTTAQDDAGVATNCTVQTTPDTGTDAACSLRDALAQSAALGSANITFDGTAFSAGNTAAQNTITLGSASTLQVPGNTNITGPFSGSGSTLATLVTISGNKQYGVIQVSSGVVSLTGLSMVNGSTVSGGGVNNSGVLTVTNCNIANSHSSSGHSPVGGGGIFNAGTLTIAQSLLTGNTADQGGGGLASTGPLTVLASVFQGNSGRSGGGLYVGHGSANVINATITGNYALMGGGTQNSAGLTLTNTILSGNTDLAGNANTYGGFTDNGGNIVGTAANLSALGSYGGPTQTVLPLPGSVAICAGTLAKASSAGITTDQRGYGFNPNCPAGFIDAGAAQTDYALSFTPEPPAAATIGVALTTSPGVTLTENGTPLAAAISISVGDTASPSALAATSTLSASTSSGVATFSNLVFGSPATGDKLTATLPLTASTAGTPVTLTAQSTGITTAALPPAAAIKITVPATAYQGGSFPVTVVAVTASGNADAFYTGTVAFTSSDTGASLPGNYTFTAADAGTHTFSATLITTGSQTITATDSADSLIMVSTNIAVSVPNLVVTTAQDDAGTATNCTVQTTPGTGTDASCSLRDALALDAQLGSASITFDGTAFRAANTAAQNTITLASGGTLQVPPNTTITGPFSGSGSSLATLVTISGNNQYGVIGVNAGVVSLAGLSIVNGSAGSGGGVNNSGTLTLTNCNIANNQSTNDPSHNGGGGIFSSGTLTIARSLLTDNVTNSFGGGLYMSGGRLSILTSVFQGNSATMASGGGLMFTGGSANIINGTISGNSALEGGGIQNDASLELTNTIVSGNAARFLNPDTSGGFTDNGGNVVGTAANLSALGSYGGPTQTVLPLPGSVAICAGTLANATAAGISTDQRGLGFDPNCPAGFVDAGAAQTNYALSFTQSPGSEATGQTLSPTPIVTVTESGSPLTAGLATISLSDGSGTLAGTTSANTSTSNGQAAFSNLTVGAADASDSLTATLTLNASLSPALHLTATGGSFAIHQTTPVITWNTPAPIAYGTALSATQLNATSSVPGTFAYTPTATTVIGAGSQTLSVKFTPTDSVDYAAVTKTATLLVNQASPTVTWATPGPITYGTALSATQLNATSSVPGTFAYTPTATTVVGAGSQTLSVKFTPTDSVDYAAVTKTVTLLVNPASPTVTWATPGPITYGTALSATQLNATATVPGSFAYLPAATTVVGAGSQTLSVKFTPADSVDYAAVTKTVTLLVNQVTPVVTWNTPAPITYGTALSTAQLNATATVTGSFAYLPAATTVLSAGSKTLSVKFTPSNTNYPPVTKTVTLQINQAAPVVKWASPAVITYGTALSATQLGAIVSVPGTFRYAPSFGAVPAAGQLRICLAFTPTDSVDYKPAANSVYLTVNRATTTTTLSIVTMQTVGGTTAAITPTVKPQIGGSPTGTLTYLNGSTVLGSAAVGAVFTTPVLAAGTDKISAIYQGDANFLTSTSVQTSITGVAPTTVDFAVLATKLIYPQPAVYGVVVPLVNGKSITGSITIFDGTVAVSTTPIPSRGILVGITLPSLKVGTHILKAVYNGGNYPPGQSAPQTVMVVSK